MRFVGALLVACIIRAQNPVAPQNVTQPPQPDATASILLHYEGKPVAVPFACTDDDMQWAGMSCSDEEPCPVYLELSEVDAVGTRILLLGNLHTGSTTLYSLLLSSDDGGVTWKEPYERMRGVGLNHIQLFDFQNGWISGGTMIPVARDPFFLITSDGGKSWRLRPVVAEGTGGAIRQFHFDSASSGVMVVDRMQSAESSRYELYETPNGGETWMIRRTSNQAIDLPQASREALNNGWRIRADQRSKSFAIEKLKDDKWIAVGSFLVQAGSCKAEVRPLEPPPEPETEAPHAPPAAPSLQKPRRKP